MGGLRTHSWAISPAAAAARLRRRRRIDGALTRASLRLLLPASARLDNVSHGDAAPRKPREVSALVEAARARRRVRAPCTALVLYLPLCLFLLLLHLVPCENVSGYGYFEGLLNSRNRL